jgi:hypothetical protein
MKDQLGQSLSRSRREIEQLHNVIEGQHRIIAGLLRLLGGEASLTNSELNGSAEINVEHTLDVGSGPGVKMSLMPVIEIKQGEA